MTITLTTTKNQKNALNNITMIDLGECENILRRVNNISDNETIYMKKTDVKQEGMKIPKIEYDVYCRKSGSQLTRLNLSVCEDTKVSLSIPIKISEDNLDILNTSSGYYSDKCYKAASDSGTDISLKDRQKDFVEGNKTICQEECDFAEYDSYAQKANCSCSIKESSKNFENMNINRTKLYENFDDINDKMSVSNLGITSCNVLSSKENIQSNAGFFLLLIILALFIIIFIIFCTRGYNSLENKFDEVIHKKFKNETKSKTNKITNTLTKETKENKIVIKSNKSKKNQKKTRHKKEPKIGQRKNNSIKLDNSGKIPMNKGIIKNNFSINNSTLFRNKTKNTKTKENQQLKPDTDYEYNWLEYEEAIKYDKRTNCDYYGSLIKNKQLFIFTFCSYNDYNSGVVKKFMLFLSFSLHYTSNALFFTESNLHQIYEDEGKFNFEYQYSYILFSAIISTAVLRIMLQFLVLTDKDVLEVKKQTNKNAAVNMKKEKLKCLKIKFAIFFILNFILLGLFWYYLTCFNAIYQNTQVYLIKNTCISFAFSLFYPFIINILPTLFRMCSIHSTNKDQKCLYKFSQILQVI